MGSAVDAPGLTAELESLRAVGLGGVEITPIYGVLGTESQFIPYLSDQWVRLLQHTVHEALRVDLGVDMATGTGWPFGGPWVGEADACRGMAYRSWTVEGGAKLAERVRLQQTPLVRAIGTQVSSRPELNRGRASNSREPAVRTDPRALRITDLEEPVEANANLQALALEQVRFPKALPLAALMAYSRDGTVIDLTVRVNTDGVLDWTAPPGTWRLFAVFLGWHGKLVERAAPDGEGNVIDHFSRVAIRHYLARFDRAFAGHDLKRVRAFFNDSYEVDDASGQADATPELFREFQRRRGYDLRRHLPELLESTADARSARVIADYRLTISDLLLETFTSEWRDWAKKHGAIVRNQAHGSPGNLLDLYAASDIPETEGTEIPRALWASSAAHVAGRRLVSAETATWLGEHFRTTLADVRAAIDRLFVAGVNHIVYHGTAYSPTTAPWPGRLFYASVEFNSRNSWWSDFAALNGYVTRAQSFLQAGTPDQDILVYYPFYDSLARPDPNRLRHFGVANPPSEGTPFEEAATMLQRRGYTFDFISDHQLAATRVQGRQLITPGGGSYKTLVVPASRYIPVDTFERIVTLVREGATVIAFKGLASEPSGLGDLDRHRALLARLRNGIAFQPGGRDGVSWARVGLGMLLLGGDLEALLSVVAVTRETLVDRGLQFARRRFGSGRSYFIVGMPEQPVDGWIPLDDRSRTAVIFDPMTWRYGDAPVRQSPAGTLEVRLSVPPGTSLIVTTALSARRPFYAFDPAGQPEAIGESWRVRFTAGGPRLPRERTIDRLGSWTNFGGEEVRQFSGTATYTTTFKRPAAKADAWQLDLGGVHDSASVRLNDSDLRTLIGPSFQLVIPAETLVAENVLEVQVSNLMANRIAALDKAGVPWRTFYNVNFPARFPQNRGADGLFSAAKWEPLDSGLMGPVTLTPLKRR